jgi:hypothetical protein
MPTGYTAAVQDGKITEFSMFALQCARAFDALIDMRNEPPGAPVPDRLEPHTSYYDDLIAAATARLTETRGLTEEECTKRATAAHADALDQHRQRQRERVEQRIRYEVMLTKVEAWEPPTPDHVGLRDFMVSQLRESIRFDCDGMKWSDPQLQSPEDWCAAMITSAERDLEYGTDKRREEIERTEKRNQWLTDLRASLT